MLQNTFYKKKSSMTVPLFRQFVPTINTKVLLLETKHFSDLSLLFWKSEALAFLLWCTFAFLWHVTFLLWILHLIEGAVIGSSRTKDFHPSLMIWSGDQKFITERESDTKDAYQNLFCSFCWYFLLSNEVYLNRANIQRGKIQIDNKMGIFSILIHPIKRWQNFWKMHESISQFF